MNIHDYAKLCTVWHLDDFWHIHVNAKIYSFHPDLTDFMIRVSQNTKLPIRWTTANHHTVRWTTDGHEGGSFEPSVYSTYPGVYANMIGYDPDSGAKSLMVNMNTGAYSTGWGCAQRYPHNKLISLATFKTNTDVWGALCWNYEEYHTMPHIMDTYLSGDAVRYYEEVIRKWAASGNFNDIEFAHIDSRLDGLCTKIHDAGVTERGYVTNDFVPELVRLIRHRYSSWVSSVDTTSRLDGPSVVAQHMLKQIISGDINRTTSYGGYEQTWWIRGKNISEIQVQEWARKHGIVIRQGQLADQSAFTDPTAQLAWAAYAITL